MGIKAKRPLNVNSPGPSTAGLLAACLALMASGVATGAFAQEASPPDQPPPSVPSPLDPLPDIQARDFPVKVQKRSKSGRTYMFEDVSDAKTRPGKILLLRRESVPIMAFRVVKTYPGEKKFAAKRVRRYGDIHVIDAGDSYAALEKVGDIAIPPPTAQDTADLKELEGGAGTGAGANTAADAAADAGADGAPGIPPTAPGPEVRPYDPDLDAGTSPPPSGAVDSENSRGAVHAEDEEEAMANLGMAIDEVNVLDPNHQWLTGSFGFFRNNTPTGGAAFFAGGGVRYGLTLGKMVFLRRARAQDSIAVEGGAFYYKIINFESRDDAYEVLPLIGTVRYNIAFGENFGIFFYGGIMQNNVTRASGGTVEARAALSSVLPAMGGGFLFRVGPNWDTRVDLGYDVAALGLVLRF